MAGWPPATRARHLLRLDPEGRFGGRPRCEVCGLDVLEALVAISMGKIPELVRRIFQAHHVGGRVHGGMVVVLCVLCHAVVTAGQDPYKRLLGKRGAAWWERACVWHLDQATLLERMAAEHRRRADELKTKFAGRQA
jgi:hypothetical protein